MAHTDRRNSISLSEQCEIMQVLGDLVLSYNFDLELKRINQQIITMSGHLNENMERDEDVCSLYDPDEIFYTLLSDALASR
jgi:predicted phosphodiesterase